MFTLAFWRAALERAIKTAAQALLSTGIVGAAGILDVDWPAALSVAGLAAAGSVLTSLISSGVGGEGPALGTETLSPSVAAETAPASPTGLAAGPAADVPEGAPVSVQAAITETVQDALSQPYSGDSKLDAATHDWEGFRG